MIGSYLSCKDSTVKNSNAINFYIFDSPWQKNQTWKTSYAYFNGHDAPAILANWQTLASGYKSPDIHEMGHLFGLNHTSACSTTDETPTYAMASPSEDCIGTGGNRKLGFTKNEIKIIQENISKIKKAIFR